MPIDFDPVFHTETMVKILREQGSTQYAMELAELILQKNPEHQGVRKLLEELREDARRAFERFKSGGRIPESEAVRVETVEVPEAEAAVAEPEVAFSEIEALPIAEPEAPPEPALVDRPVERVVEEILHEPVRLTLVPSPVRVSSREKKIQRLQSMLARVQILRKAADASQA